MASSTAEYILANGSGGDVYHNSLTNFSKTITDIPNGGSKEFSFKFADTGTPNQTMPLGTNVTVSLSAGTLQGETNFTVSNNSQEGFSQMNFFVIQEADSDPQTAVLTITITSPSGVVTGLTRSMELL